MSSKALKVQIKHQLNGRVIFKCNVPKGVYSILRYSLEKAVVGNADLCNANLIDANLIYANLIRANLIDANLSDANLSGADLSEANLSGADLSGADLIEANLIRANLCGADLSGADLSEADLSEANLSGADLRNTDMQNVNLKNANLDGANLDGANLDGAHLAGADLNGANLNGVDLRNVNDIQLPRATPAQAIVNLDKVRAILLDDHNRLNMDHWHGDNDWPLRTCAEEVLCGTTHCMTGWLQVCTAEPLLKKIDAQLAGILAAPVAAKMFYKKAKEVMEWLESRAYVAEYEKAEKLAADHNNFESQIGESAGS